MKFILVIVLGLGIIANVCLAQLPFQVKPRPRGFPGKRCKNDASRVAIIGRGAIEGMYRLNDTFHPSHYDVEVRVILDEKDGVVGPEFTAPGKVKIVGVNREKTSRIVMHANELKINDSTITVTTRTNPQESIKVANITEDTLPHFLILELDREISAGVELEIYMEYTAKILEAEEGLFYRTYETETGENRKVAATQLESVEARRMYPCFDEPDLKATFELTVIRRNEYTALSNTELVSSTPDPEYDGWTIDKFARTVKMSTYNLALAVTDYGYKEAFFGEKAKPTRIYDPTFLIEAGGGDYAAKVASSCLSFYESFFNESYKLSKMDSVVIPEFGGAMENWGLNVYGFDYLLHFPDENSEAHTNLVTMIVAHELAHQWFGNLVTMKWWNELYLTEGLSTYTQYLGMEAANPDLRGLEFAILDAFQYSMLYDAGPFTHPLSWNVSTPDEIDGMFSTISYEKGASVFRMVEGFLTKETFRKGLQLYLSRHSFGGAKQEDLFECLEEAAIHEKRLPQGLTVPKIMSGWVNQYGFPLVKVDVLGNDTIILTQKPFINKLAFLSEPNTNRTWFVPVTIVSEGKPARKDNIPEVWLEADGYEKEIVHNVSEWIMINHNATGFYRVIYDNSIAQLIQVQLDKDANVISPFSRTQLLDDYFVFARQGYVNIQTALNFTRYLHQERHFTVWNTFFDHFSPIYKRFSSHIAYPLIQRFLRPKVDSALLAIGLEEAPRHKGAAAILRADLLDWSCSLQSPLCREYARKLFAQWRVNASTSPITSIDAQATLECAMVATGGRQAYDFFFTRYQEAGNDSDSRAEILSSIACTMEPVILQNLLEMTVNATSGLHPSDTIFVLEKVAANPTGRLIILQFMSANINYIVDEIGSGTATAVASVLSTLSKYFCTKDHLEQVQSFIKLHKEKLSTSKATLKSTLNRIYENVEWMESTGSEIWKWMWLQKGVYKISN